MCWKAGRLAGSLYMRSRKPCLTQSSTGSSTKTTPALSLKSSLSCASTVDFPADMFPSIQITSGSGACMTGVEARDILYPQSRRYPSASVVGEDTGEMHVSPAGRPPPRASASNPTRLHRSSKDHIQIPVESSFGISSPTVCLNALTVRLRRRAFLRALRVSLATECR